MGKFERIGEALTRGFESWVKNSTFQRRLSTFLCVIGLSIGIYAMEFIEPRGEVSNSVLGIVSECLLLCGALAGLNVSFNNKFKAFKEDIVNKLEENNISSEELKDKRY